jgi:antitoxin ParD1/3/4/toxin ParE1/3/4
MSNYVVSPRANDDIFGIWHFLFERAGVDVANRVESELYAAFETLAQNPGVGHRRSDLTSHPVLFFSI